MPGYDPASDVIAAASLQSLFPGPPRGHHRLPGPGLGPGRLSLPHPAVACVGSQLELARYSSVQSLSWLEPAPWTTELRLATSNPPRSTSGAGSADELPQPIVRISARAAAQPSTPYGAPNGTPSSIWHQASPGRRLPMQFPTSERPDLLPARDRIASGAVRPVRARSPVPRQHPHCRPGRQNRIRRFRCCRAVTAATPMSFASARLPSQSTTLLSPASARRCSPPRTSRFTRCSSAIAGRMPGWCSAWSDCSSLTTRWCLMKAPP